MKTHRPFRAPARTLAMLAVALSLLMPAAAWADNAPPPADSQNAQASPAPAAEAHSAPFGALSLFALGGMLFAGLVIGVGVGSFRRRAAVATDAPVTRAPVPASEEEWPAPPVETVAESAPHAGVLVLADLEDDVSVDHDLDHLVASLSEGPRYRPVVTAIVALQDGAPKAELIARIAEIARRRGLDVAVVDCGGEGPTALAAELDAWVEARPSRRVPGASARIRILDPAELLPKGQRATVGAWRQAFETLAQRADVILVDSGPVDARYALPTDICAVDEIIVLDDGSASDLDILDLFEAADRNGPQIAGRILASPLRRPVEYASRQRMRG